MVALLFAFSEDSGADDTSKHAGRAIYMLTFLPLSILFNWLGCKALRAAGRTTEDGRPVGVQSGDVLGFIFLGPLCTPFCVRRLNRLGGHGPWSMLTSIFLPILTVVLLYLVTEGISSEDVRRQGIAEAHRVDFDMDTSHVLPVLRFAASFWFPVLHAVRRAGRACAGRSLPRVRQNGSRRHAVLHFLRSAHDGAVCGGADSGGRRFPR